MLENAGVHYKACFTGGVDNAIAISRKSSARGYRKFIAVGGDGTIHDVLNGIAEFLSESSDPDVSFDDFTLAVLPVGSGNDWVKSAGIPCDVSEAVRIIADGHTGLQDVVKVTIQDSSRQCPECETVSYMANIGGIGLDASVCERVNEKKERGRRGKQLYVSALLYCIRHRVPVRARVICDGNEVFNGKYLSIAFGVGKYSGGGMRQTPQAVLDDGLLDVTIIPDIPIWTIAKEVPKLFTGTFHTVDVLTMARCRDVQIIPESEADAEPVEVDGEVIGRVPARMEVVSKQIRVVMPDRR
jgi:YegS/Rv2252/BmrU family lipid kinase